MSIELAIAIWLFCVLYATGSLDNLAAKGIVALARLTPLRTATSSRLNRESAARSVPSRPRGHNFDNPNRLEWKWPK